MKAFCTSELRPLGRLASKVLTGFLLVLSAVIFGLVGCHAPFSKGFRENHRLKPQELKNIQFYTSDRILLRRSDNRQNRSLAGHRFDIRGEVEVEEIEIGKGTPCVAVEIRGEYIAVSFSPQDRDHVLWFSTVHSPDPGQYALTHLTDFPADQNTPNYSSGYSVRYGSLDYRVVEPQTWQVYLEFDKDVSLNRRLTHSSPDGWELGTNPKNDDGTRTSTHVQSNSSPTMVPVRSRPEPNDTM